MARVFAIATKNKNPFPDPVTAFMLKLHSQRMNRGMINSPKIFAQGLTLILLGSACSAPQPLESLTTLVSTDSAKTQVAAQPGSNPCTLVDNGFGPQGQVQVRVEEVVSGLEVPWGIAFLPDNWMLVTERSGRIRLVRNGKLHSQPIATVNVSDRGEGGLLGIAAHPDFAQNQFFYIYFTASAQAGSVNRVERWKLSADGLQATRDRIIVDNIPVARFHNGGRIRFGPDGMLYIGTGDARDPNLSQEVNSLAGKILRVTPDGQVPLWVSDHGPSGELGRSGHDEVSIAQAGDNLGWPTVYRCESKPGLVPPTITWRQALPPGGASVYTGQAIPEWTGSFIVATLRAEQLQRIVVDPSTGQLQEHEIYLQGQYGRLRETVMAPDGDLYVTTSNCDGRGSCPIEQDKILRITR